MNPPIIRPTINLVSPDLVTGDAFTEDTLATAPEAGLDNSAYVDPDRASTVFTDTTTRPTGTIRIPAGLLDIAAAVVALKDGQDAFTSVAADGTRIEHKPQAPNVLAVSADEFSGAAVPETEEKGEEVGFEEKAAKAYTRFLGTLVGGWYIKTASVFANIFGAESRIAALYKRRGDALLNYRRKFKPMAGQYGYATRKAIGSYERTIEILSVKKASKALSGGEKLILADAYFAKGRELNGMTASKESLERSNESLDHSIDLFAELGADRTRAKASELSGDVSLKLMDKHAALSRYDAAIELFERSGEDHSGELVRLHTKMARIFSGDGNYTSAAEAYGKVVEIQLRSGNLEGARVATMNQVAELSELGKDEDAGDVLYSLADVYYRKDRKVESASFLDQAAEYYMKAYAKGSGSEMFKRAQDTVVRAATARVVYGKDSPGAASSLKSFAASVESLGEENEFAGPAAEVWRRVGQVYYRSQDFRLAGEADMKAGELFEKLHIWGRALEAYEAAERALIQVESHHATSKAMEAQAIVREKRGDPSKEDRMKAAEIREAARTLADTSSRASAVLADRRRGEVVQREMAINDVAQEARRATTGHGNIEAFERFLEKAAKTFSTQPDNVRVALADGTVLWTDRIEPALKFRPGLDLDALRSAAKTSLDSKRSEGDKPQKS